MSDFTKPFRRLAPKAEPEIDEKTGLATFVFNTEDVGRDGHIVRNAGIRVESYRANPVILFAHDDGSPPIGRAAAIRIGDPACTVDISFTPPDVYPFGALIGQLVKRRYLNACSESWQPLKWHFRDGKDPAGGLIFDEVELLEISIVPIPALPEAIVTARGAGIDTGPLYEWAERILDSGGMILVPRSELEALRRASKMAKPITFGRGSADWKVGASKNLPIEDSDTWDGSAAQKSIFEWAGGDEFDSTKARKGFLVYDASAADKRGSYKLPIAHVVDGELKVPKGAIKAALSRISQTDIPADVKDRAQAVLDHYKEKAGIGDDDEDKDGARSAAAAEQRAIIGDEPGLAAKAKKAENQEVNESDDEEDDRTGDEERAGGDDDGDDDDQDDDGDKDGDDDDDDEEDDDDDGGKKGGKGGRGAPSRKRRAGALRFRRGLYECGQLAYLLQQLGCMHGYSEFEEALEEDDDSQLPQLLGEAVKAAADAFLAMAKEETEELLEQIEGGEDEVTDGERAFVAGGANTRIRAFRRGIAVARAGKALSSANQEKLATADNHLKRAMKHHGDQGEHLKEVGEHTSELRAVHKRATQTLAELGFDHHRVTRAMDDMSDRIDELSDSHADATDSHSMIGRSVKSAQRCMRAVIDGGTSPEEADHKGSDPESRAARLERARKLRVVPA